MTPAEQRAMKVATEAQVEFNWTGVINKLRTGHYAYKLGVRDGFMMAIKDQPEVLALLEALEKSQACLNDLMKTVNWGASFGPDFALLNETLLTQDRTLAQWKSFVGSK